MPPPLRAAAGKRNGRSPKPELSSPLLAEIRTAAGERYGPLGVSADRGAACAALLRASRVVLTRLTEALTPLDLTILQSDVLGALGLAPDRRMSVASLRQHTLMHSATMSNTLEELEARGFLRRERDEADRRIVIVSLTKAGVRKATEATIAVSEIGCGIEEVEDDDLDALTTTLARIGLD